jgi:hypothetical protein
MGARRREFIAAAGGGGRLCNQDGILDFRLPIFDFGIENQKFASTFQVYAGDLRALFFRGPL